MPKSRSHTQGEPRWVTTRDGRRLFAQVLEGPSRSHVTPTVVFESGSAGDRSTWGLVQPPVASFARSVVFDRSGMGRSPADPVGRTFDRMADDLIDVCETIAPGPVVLVGHSAGGPTIRLAAARRPNQMRGLVLVDPSDEADDVTFSPALRAVERVLLEAEMALARMKLLHLFFGSTLRAMPPDVHDDLLRDGFTPGMVRTQVIQAQTFTDELSSWRTDPPAVTDAPMTIISGAVAGDGMTSGMRRAATAAHEIRAASSLRGRHVIATRSAHDVPITEPGLVIGEIHRLVDALD